MRSLRFGGLCPEQIGFGVLLFAVVSCLNLSPNLALDSNISNISGGFAFKFSVPNLALDSNISNISGGFVFKFSVPNLVLESNTENMCGGFVSTF